MADIPAFVAGASRLGDHGGAGPVRLTDNKKEVPEDELGGITEPSIYLQYCETGQWSSPTVRSEDMAAKVELESALIFV